MVLENSELLYKKIVAHLCNVSFGFAVNQDHKIIATLYSALPLLDACLDENPALDIKIAFDVAASLNLDVLSMKQLDEKRRCFEAALVMLLSLREEGKRAMWSDVSVFLDAYPMFQCITDACELRALLHFRNLTKVTLMLLHPLNKKAHIMDLVTRICEGRDVKYVTGSGEKKSTRRRVLIYEKEGDITPIPRPRMIKGVLQSYSDYITHDNVNLNSQNNFDGCNSQMFKSSSNIRNISQVRKYCYFNYLLFF